jgi:hypothetical protein
MKTQSCTHWAKVLGTSAAILVVTTTIGIPADIVGAAIVGAALVYCLL